MSRCSQGDFVVLPQLALKSSKREQYRASEQYSQYQSQQSWTSASQPAVGGGISLATRNAFKRDVEDAIATQLKASLQHVFANAQNIIDKQLDELLHAAGTSEQPSQCIADLQAELRQLQKESRKQDSRLLELVESITSMYEERKKKQKMLARKMDKVISNFERVRQQLEEYGQGNELSQTRMKWTSRLRRRILRLQRSQSLEQLRTTLCRPLAVEYTLIHDRLYATASKASSH